MKESNTNKRWEICQACSICDTDNWICNPHLYVNPINNDSSVNPKEGYIKGCGCLLTTKIPRPDRHCPAKKW